MVSSLESIKEFVRRDGTQFKIGDYEFKFVGFNIRGLAHYGHVPRPHVLENSTEQQRTSYLREAKACGSSVVRIFLPHSCVRSDDELIKRLGEVLRNATDYEQRIIVCLTDHFETSKFQHWSFFDDKEDPLEGYIEGDTVDWNKRILGSKFYKDLYKGSFLDYVRNVVTTFKNHPAVFCWELTNEGGNHPDHNAFIDFCNDMASKIREIDSNHMITAGIISTEVIQFKEEYGNEPQRLYENLDFLTIHSYPSTRNMNLPKDAELAKSLNKPFIIEEIGNIPTTADWLRKEMHDWFSRGASGILGWAFDPERNGDGDKDTGIPSNNMDYDAIIQVWKEQAKTFTDVLPQF